LVILGSGEMKNIVVGKRCVECKHCDFNAFKCDGYNLHKSLDLDMIGEKIKCDMFSRGKNYDSLPKVPVKTKGIDAWAECPNCGGKCRMTLRFPLFEVGDCEFYQCVWCGEIFGVL